MEDKVSIIIPCRNEKQYIGQCMSSLLSNDYPSKEIIVVDGLSDDGTRDILNDFVHKYNNVKLISNPKKITPVALNLGLNEASGNYIMIAGAHASFPVNYISKMVKKLDELENAAGIGGAIKTDGGNTYVAHSIVRVMTDKMGVGNSMFRIGTEAPIKVDTLPYGLYKKEVFERIGKYDERLVRNQDIELSKRILRNGSNLYLIPKIKCYYFFKGNYRHLARSNFNNGLWNILTFYITKKLSSLSLRHFIPFLFVLAILIPSVLSIFLQASLIYISLSVLLTYLVVIVVKSIFLLNRNTRFIYLIWSFLVLHFAYGLGSLVGLFHFKKLLKH